MFFDLFLDIAEAVVVPVVETVIDVAVPVVEVAADIVDEIL